MAYYKSAGHKQKNPKNHNAQNQCLESKKKSNIIQFPFSFSWEEEQIVKGHSLTTLTRFWLFLTTYSKVQNRRRAGNKRRAWKIWQKE